MSTDQNLWLQCLQKCLSLPTEHPPNMILPSLALSIPAWLGLPYLIGITPSACLHLGHGRSCYDPLLGPCIISQFY